jgi:hypothetical protein
MDRLVDGGARAVSEGEAETLGNDLAFSVQVESEDRQVGFFLHQVRMEVMAPIAAAASEETAIMEISGLTAVVVPLVNIMG